MLVFLRGLPWVIAMVCLLVFGWLSYDPQLFFPLIGASLLVLAFCLSRLIDLPRSDFGFWNFLLVPVGLLAAAGFAFIFFESTTWTWILAGVVSFLEWVYAEHVFAYFHQPSRYRVYTIERVSMTMAIVSTFLGSSGLFGLLILLQLPLWLIAPVFFVLMTFTMYSVLWVSKADPEQGATSSFVGGLLLTEVFIALSFLPVGHMTNGSVLTVCFYLFLGMTRASLLGRLTRPVVLRYLLFALTVALVALSTTRWV